MKENNIITNDNTDIDIPEQEFYDELMSYGNNYNPESRLMAASMIMERCGDNEMADTLRLLSAQMQFDDNEEACPAIDRTRNNLDKMIAERLSRKSMKYITILRDNEIIDVSNGEVKDDDYDYIRSRFCKDGLFDPDIFGGSGKIPLYDEENDRIPNRSFGIGIGHIQLPCHVTLKKDHSMIAELLDMTEEDVKKVINYGAHIIINPGDSGFKKHSVITEEEYIKYKDDENFEAGIGSDGIHEALKNLNYKDEPERLSFTVIPVVPPIMRPMAYSKEDEAYHGYPINKKYNKVIWRSKRIKKLQEFDAPEMIMRNEGRMLNDEVNELIDFTSDSIAKTHWKNTSIYNFIHRNLQTLMRERYFFVKRLTKEELKKTDEIESLNIYPENIRLYEDGRYSEISLYEVIDHNDDAISDYKMKNMIPLPIDDIDDDEEIDIETDERIDEETKKKIKKVNKTLDRMNKYNDDIFEGSKTEREKYTVKYSKKNKMYIPEK